MASRTIGTTDKDQVARQVIGLAYGSLNTGQISDVDEAARVALNKVNQVGQFLTYASRTADSASPTTLDIGEFFNWWRAEAALILAKSYKADLERQFRQARNEEMRDAISTYTTYGSTGLGGTGVNAGMTTSLTLNVIRNYVVGSMIRRPKPIFPDIAVIDPIIQDVLNELWNMTGWPFRRRQVRIVVTPISLTGGTWTESTKTLTIGTSTYSHSAGNRIRVTGGTGATAGEYTIASVTSNTALVLTSSLSTAGTSLSTGDIAGTVLNITMHGLESGDVFDSIATRKLRYESTASSASSWPYLDVPMDQWWADADNMARAKSYVANSSGRPAMLRLQSIAGTRTWMFYPWPDVAYTVYGEVFIKGPTLPSDASVATAFSAFPPEFRPVIRDLCLSRVLSRHGDSSLEAEVRDRAMDLAASYDDSGNIDIDQSIRDVYGDNQSTMNVGVIW